MYFTRSKKKRRERSTPKTELVYITKIFLNGFWEERKRRVRRDSKVTQEKVMRRDRLRGGSTWTDMKTEDTHTEGRGNEDR